MAPLFVIFSSLIAIVLVYQHRRGGAAASPRTTPLTFVGLGAGAAAVYASAFTWSSINEPLVIGIWGLIWVATSLALTSSIKHVEGQWQSFVYGLGLALAVGGAIALGLVLYSVFGRQGAP
jgi:hypothetical protein